MRMKPLDSRRDSLYKHKENLSPWCLPFLLLETLFLHDPTVRYTGQDAVRFCSRHLAGRGFL